MTVEYHLTPEGPRRCFVDPSNPNSTGCKYGNVHFDNMADAMEVYTEDLKSTFGEFHVLVRPSISERARRVGYKSLDGIEKVKASPQVQAAVKTMKSATAEVRAKVESLRSGKPAVLPESIETEPLVTMYPEQVAAEETSTKVFSSGVPESIVDFGSRITSSAGRAPFHMSPLDMTEVNRALAIIEAYETARAYGQANSRSNSRARKMKSYRSNRKRKIATAASMVKAAFRSKAGKARQSMVDTGYIVRATGSVAKDAAILRARATAARTRDLTKSAASSVKSRASKISVPAGHIRAGDTFDGTTVRSVQSLGDGRVKIGYQAAPGGPILATTLDRNRSMSVDRKTRREARNSLISARVATPVAQTKAFSQRVVKASSEQLNRFRPVQKSDLRFVSIEKTLRQNARDVRQIELISQLRKIRSNSQDRVLQQV